MIPSCTTPLSLHDTSTQNPGVALSVAGRLRADPRHGGVKLLPRAAELEAVLAAVSRGAVITRAELMRRLLARWGGDRVAPRAFTLALRELEAAAVTRLNAGREPEIAVWRLLRDDGTVDPRSPLKPLYAATRLRAEGQCVAWARGAWKVLAPGVH